MRGRGTISPKPRNFQLSDSPANVVTSNDIAPGTDSHHHQNLLFAAKRVAKHFSPKMGHELCQGSCSRGSAAILSKSSRFLEDWSSQPSALAFVCIQLPATSGL